MRKVCNNLTDLLLPHKLYFLLKSFLFTDIPGSSGVATKYRSKMKSKCVSVEEPKSSADINEAMETNEIGMNF